MMRKLLALSALLPAAVLFVGVPVYACARVHVARVAVAYLGIAAVVLAAFAGSLMAAMWGLEELRRKRRR